MNHSAICEAPSQTALEKIANHGRKLSREARMFLERLIKLQLFSSAAAEKFLEQTSDHLPEFSTPEMLGGALVQSNLLTEYQLDRALAGTTHGLILGNHRVLNRLGSGAMGVVFLAEHVILKRRAAVKVLPLDDDCPTAILERFYSEMRVLADLYHPNIVLAYDAGQLAGAGPGMPAMLYLVMELVSGGDLEQYLIEHGPVEIAQACEWIRQAACGLQEAHDRHLIHRDLKPSNLLLTGQRQVKLVDFGLARQFCSRLTDPRALLGTLEYMAPEQSLDPSAVNAPADIYGLGATLFGLLTGETPYPPVRSVAEALRMLQKGEPRRLRSLRPDAPEALDELVDRMLQRDPTKRPALPITVMNALLPFTPAMSPMSIEVARQQSARRDDVQGSVATSAQPDAGRISMRQFESPRRVLVIDDEPIVRNLARSILQTIGCICDDAEDAGQGLAALQKNAYDLVLLDLNLPDMDGYEVCRRLREHPVQAHLKIVVISGRGDQNQLAEALPLGADDYIAKPFGTRQLIARVQHVLQLKAAQDQADSFADQLARTNRQFESSLSARSGDVRQAQDALLFAMAKMAESREGETSDHLRRLQRYSRCLAEQVAAAPNWAGVVNHSFLEQLERCVPLHDIGKMGLPESVLLKPGRLTDEERRLMETHTVIGDRILEAIGKEHGQSLAFLGMASAIVRHHHERYDGTGYPDRLCGEEIPPAARLTALADVYDALRRRRLHKPALTHIEAAKILLEQSAGQFDPFVLQAFAVRQHDFERIYRETNT